MKCPQCNGVANKYWKLESHLYKKELVRIQAPYYYCNFCHLEFTTTENDDYIMKEIIKKYKLTK